MLHFFVPLLLLIPWMIINCHFRYCARKWTLLAGDAFPCSILYDVLFRISYSNFNFLFNSKFKLKYDTFLISDNSISGTTGLNVIWRFPNFSLNWTSWVFWNEEFVLLRSWWFFCFKAWKTWWSYSLANPVTRFSSRGHRFLNDIIYNTDHVWIKIVRIPELFFHTHYLQILLVSRANILDSLKNKHLP